MDMTEHERSVYEAIQDECVRKIVIVGSINAMLPTMFGKSDRWHLIYNKDDNGMQMNVSDIMAVSVYCNDRLLAWQSLNGDSPAQMAIDIMAAVSRSMDK